jgi:hypothetical protein
MELLSWRTGYRHQGKVVTFPCIGTLFRDDDGFI